MATSCMLGLMTHYVGSPSRFSRQTRAALSEGFAEVAVFTPGDVSLSLRRISAYVSRGRGWVRRMIGFPRISIDLGFYDGGRWAAASMRVKNCRSLPFIGYGLGNKWKIQSHLLQSSELKEHLLPTLVAERATAVMQFVDEHRHVMLKPINGKCGRGIIRLSSHGGGRFAAKDNRASRRFGSAAGAGLYVRHVLGRGRHLMQRWIDIRSNSGLVYDIRALVQKNGRGEWQLSGTAVREGRPNRITSNLKTGGRACELAGYLRGQFGSERGAALVERVHALAAHIPAFLEESYGIRLCELGIDLAVDRDGRLWLLEVNIKPGRSVIRRIYGQGAFEQCFRMPFRYALHLARLPHIPEVPAAPMVEASAIRSRTAWSGKTASRGMAGAAVGADGMPVAADTEAVDAVVAGIAAAGAAIRAVDAGADAGDAAGSAAAGNPDDDAKLGP